MSLSSPGRPPKPEGQKRQQLHFSLYEEDIARLEQLTDNRSEFIRQCIAQSWYEKCDGDQTITLTVPKWLVKELILLIQQRMPPRRVAIVQALVEELFAEN